jgi:hypothetical protein
MSMARFTAVDATRSAGFDEERSLLIMQAGKTAELYLIAGEYLEITTDDPEICRVVSAVDKDVPAAHRRVQVASTEKGEPIRLIRLEAGGRAGSTEINAVSGYMGWGSLTVRVVANAERRQVGATTGEVATTAIREELAKLSLREAVTRVAEDQMNSKICTGDGFGTYMPHDIDGHAADWCGAFAFFCWQQAAAIKHVPNPFGDDSRVLWSPQRAIGWALRNPDKAVILRYQGGDPGPHPTSAQAVWHDVGWNGNNLERGDIVMVRKLPVKGDDWRHVTQIDWVGERTLHTLDGNQGKGRSIRRRTYDLNKKLSNGLFELAFLHVLV